MNRGKTLGELVEDARRRSGAEKLGGHDIMELERFDPDTHHMIVFEVLSHESTMGWMGERIRVFLTDEGYRNALKNQANGNIEIINHANLSGGHLRYDHEDRAR